MARRGVPKGPVNWFLVEWLRTLGIKKQTELMELTGWSKATASQLVNGKQDYSPKIINEAAKGLKLEPYELLMTPEKAMRLRRLRETAVEIAHEEDPAPNGGNNEERNTTGGTRRRAGTGG